MADENRGILVCTPSVGYIASTTMFAKSTEGLVMGYKLETNICQYCNQTFTSRTSFQYCSNTCYHAARRTKTERTCRTCGKVFYKKSQGRHGDPVYCSPRCQSISKQRQIEVICRHCGRSFTRKQCQSDRVQCCSKACQNAMLTNRVTLVCLRCGVNFSVVKNRTQTARFCSRKCKKHYHGETGIEKMVRQELDALQIPYLQEHYIHPYTIDFYLPIYQIAIEVDGVYWHNPEHDQQRDAYLQQKGITTLRITDVEMKQHRAIDLIISRLGHF